MYPWKLPTARLSVSLATPARGKSTLVQHFNGLLKPNSELSSFKASISAPKAWTCAQCAARWAWYSNIPSISSLKKPWPPMSLAHNLGLSDAEVEKRARRLAAVELDYEAVKDRSPFELSGGQMRRAAIACWPWSRRC